MLIFSVYLPQDSEDDFVFAVFFPFLRLREEGKEEKEKRKSFLLPLYINSFCWRHKSLFNTIHFIFSL